MLRIAIVGSGAIGLSYGHLLNKHPKAEVTFFARSNYHALKQNGCRIVLAAFGIVEEFRPVRLYSSLKLYRDKPFDIVVITTKFEGKSPIAGLEQALGPSTLLFLVQNGVNIEDGLLETFPDTRLASAVVRVPVELKQPWECVRFEKSFEIQAGIVQPKGDPDAMELLRTLAEISITAGLSKFDIVDNIQRERWFKILWNGTFNTCSALTNLTPHEMLMYADLEPYLRSVMQEIYNTAEALLGQEVWNAQGAIDDTIAHTKSRIPMGFCPSTLQDVRKGKPIEHEALCGNIVETAARLGVSTPNLRSLNYLLKALNYRLSKA